MAQATTCHIVDEELRDPASYLTIRRGDRVYDLYGWAAGHVSEARIAMTRDEFFDGIVVGFRDRRLFVDSPEIARIHDGLVLLALTAADMSRAVQDQAPPRRSSGPAGADDSVALVASLSRVYVADRLPLPAMERALEEVLAARTCAELDAIAADALGPVLRGPAARRSAATWPGELSAM
jgi:hypothetical protein